MRTNRWWLVLGLGAVMPALAANVTSYPVMFPANACQDGWLGCLSGGLVVGAGSLKDSAGRPLAADERLGWFDLQPAPSFSPFVTLSAYSGAAGAVAVAAAPVERAPPPPRVETRPDPGQRADPVERPAPAERPVAVERPTPTVTPTAAVTPPLPTTGGGMRPPNTPTTAPTPVAATPVAVSTPTTGGGSMRPVGGTPPPDTTSRVAPVASDDCSDLVKLEPAAMMGQLSSGQAKCLEGRIATEAQQTMRDRVSRLLINNADAKGDKSEWERLVKRHLEDIDRSDPDLCYRYALQLSRGGASRAQGVIRWADYALENKSKWTGNTYKTRVFALYKLKAEAATKLWQASEAEFAEKHEEKAEQAAARYRGNAKEYAREWLDYAKASQQDTKTAMALCVSAAGSKDFCEGG